MAVTPLNKVITHHPRLTYICPGGLYISHRGQPLQKGKLMEVAFIGLILGGVLLEYAILDYCYCMLFHKFDDDNPHLSKRLDKIERSRK